MTTRRVLDAAYRRSNATLRLPVRPSLAARQLATGLLAAGDDPGIRQRLGQDLLQALSTTARIAPPILSVPDCPQIHTLAGARLRSKTYGDYQCLASSRGAVDPRIRIFHRTAIKQQAVSPKVFLHTLLHEWCHHHDIASLKLGRSLHTRGFYTRLHLLCDELFPTP
jgi:hypothetical protein